jgi:V/A-type H+-transporting ATPase subunit I
MAITPMRKLEIFGMARDREAVLSFLQELENVEILDFRKSYEDSEYASYAVEHPPSIEDLENDLARIRFCIKTLANAAQKNGRSRKGTANRVFVSSSEHRSVIEHYDFRPAVDAVVDIQNHKTECRTRLDRSLKERESLLPWQDVDLDQSDLRHYSRTGILALILSKNDFESLEQDLPKVTDRFSLHTVHATEKEISALLVFSDCDRDLIRTELGKIDFREQDIASFERPPKKTIRSLDRTIRHLRKEIEDLDAKLVSWVDQRPKLLLWEDQIGTLIARRKAEASFAETGKTFMIEGWTPEQGFAGLKMQLEDRFAALRVFPAETRDGEQPPVRLQNRPGVEPFEMVMDLYGSPSYFEMDPTPLMVPFFVVFLAMTINDAGYGLVLAMSSLFALKKLHLTRGSRKLFSILLIASFAALPMGVITGSYFGIDFTTFAPRLETVRQKLMLFDPMKGSGALIFLGICMAFGFIHISAGMLIAFYQSVKRGHVMDGVYDKLSWFVLIFGLVLLGLGKAHALPPVFGNIGQAMALAGAVVVLLFAGRTNKNPIARFGAGLYSLYGVTGYFGDILSYSRLMALGMSSGVIAMVVNTLTGMVKDVPVVGYGLAVLMFVGGHLFTIVIGLVGGFVHTLRLQFLEFFQKFLEGGGRPFRPLAPSRRYTWIVNPKSN